jgi:hypothetical protein
LGLINPLIHNSNLEIKVLQFEKGVLGVMQAQSVIA